MIPRESWWVAEAPACVLGLSICHVLQQGCPPANLKASRHRQMCPWHSPCIGLTGCPSIKLHMHRSGVHTQSGMRWSSQNHTLDKNSNAAAVYEFLHTPPLPGRFKLSRE